MFVKERHKGMAKVMMVVDGGEYEYGKYPFGTVVEKNQVNELAIKVAKERGVYTYVQKISEG